MLNESVIRLNRIAGQQAASTSAARHSKSRAAYINQPIASWDRVERECCGETVSAHPAFRFDLDCPSQRRITTLPFATVNIASSAFAVVGVIAQLSCDSCQCLRFLNLSCEQKEQYFPYCEILA